MKPGAPIRKQKYHLWRHVKNEYKLIQMTLYHDKENEK